MKFKLEIEVSFYSLRLSEDVDDYTLADLNDPEKVLDIIRDNISLDFDWFRYSMMDVELKSAVKL